MTFLSCAISILFFSSLVLGSIDCTPRDVGTLSKMMKETDAIIQAEHENDLSEFVDSLPMYDEYFKSLNHTSEQVHLWVGQNESSMWVGWISRVKYTSPQVQYGTQTSNFISVTAQRSTYEADINIEAPHFGLQGWIYEAEMINLSPSELYYYRVGDSSTNQWSETFNFTCPSTSIGSFRFAAYGDMGTFPGGGVDGRRTTQRMIERLDQLNLVIHAGDIAYAYGINHIWDLFGEQIQPLASSIPYMTVVGNHEQEDLFNYTAYSHRYSMKGNAGSPPFWYSFSFQGVFFLAISTEQDWDQGSTQYEWIENTLTSIDRSKYPWVVAFFHKPMYCSNNYTSCSGYSANLRATFEDMFNENLVNLVYFGHVHAYERTYPVYNCEVSGSYQTPGAPIYVLAGCAGALWNDHQRDWTNPQPSWSGYRETKWGWTEVTVHNSSTMSIEYFTNTEGKLTDSFTFQNYASILS